MPRHILPYNNKNKPIVECNGEELPFSYFNIVTLDKKETYSYILPEHESVAVMLTGTCKIEVDDGVFESVGKRKQIWEGMADSVYIPPGSRVKLTALTEKCEIAIPGGKCNKFFKPFRIKPNEVEIVHVGDLTTHTSRRICHILGQNADGRAGNLLVSELFAEAGCWAGYPPHKHDEERPPVETNFEEIYHYKFNPEKGFGVQFVFKDHNDCNIYPTQTGSTVLIDKGHHPSVTAPGYSMYYFTILVGKEGRSLIQYFHPDHEYLTRVIPGVNDMVNKFK